MKLITIKEAAKRNGVTRQWLSHLVRQGRVEGAIQIGTYWAVPDNWKHEPQRRKASTRASTGAV